MYVTDPPCPNCGHRGVTVTRRLRVAGYAVVAGVTTKLAATETVRWLCGACGGYGRAYPVPRPQGNPAADESAGESRTPEDSGDPVPP